MVRLATATAAQGDVVDLILVRASGPYLPDVPDTVRIVELGTRGVLTGLPKLVRYLREDHPDAIVSTLPHANIVLVLAARLARAETIAIVREASTRSARQFEGAAVKDRMVGVLIRFAYRHADAVVAVSNGVAADLQRRFGIPEYLLHVIYNPVVDDDTDARAAGPLEDAWFAPDAPPVVLSVGRLSPEKDFSTLIRAFATLRRNREARLVILGEGRERRRLEELIDILQVGSDVRLPGFVADPYPYMARAGVYVLSSIREGLPGALIQAMACGARIVSTDCPSGPAEILLDGELGDLVPMGDAEKMAASIESALDRPKDRARLLARGAEFSTSRSLRAYTDLIDRLASHRLSFPMPHHDVRR